jgi:uncharacterized protein DUF6056
MMLRTGWKNVLIIFVIASLSMALLAIAQIGLFTRYMADDYCTASELHAQGFLQSQRYWYTSWTGRFSFTFLVSLAELVGPAIVPFLPTLALALWLIVCTWTIFQFLVITRWPKQMVVALLLAELVVFATLNSTPNLVQSLYWQTGMLTYVAPLICLTLYVGILGSGFRRNLQNRANSTLSILSIPLTFTAGGFSDSYVFLQTGGLLLALALSLICVPASYKRSILPLVCTGLAGSLIALCIVVIAPGNQIRQSHFPVPPGLFWLTTRSFYHSAGFIANTIYFSPLTTLLSLALPASLALHLHLTAPNYISKIDLKKTVRLLILSPMAAFSLILFSVLPSFYALSAFLPNRARIIPQFVLICVITFWGYNAGAVLAKLLLTKGLYASRLLLGGCIVVIALVILSPLTAARRTLGLGPRARANALAWDNIDREIRAARERGEQDVVVPAIDDIEQRLGAHQTDLQLEHDPQHWKNQCTAAYYGIRSIRDE